MSVVVGNRLLFVPPRLQDDISIDPLELFRRYPIIRAVRERVYVLHPAGRHHEWSARSSISREGVYIDVCYAHEDV